jgi:aminoglycoside phosphotransferase family enzyme
MLRFLRSPAAHAAYAGEGMPVDVIETHMSWVFFVGDHVLKLKKPVRYPLLDFSTLQARETWCREEVRLNARLAPGVYRGLLAVQYATGRFSLVHGEGVIDPALTVDWLVWMRRLPALRMLDRTIADGRAAPEDVDALVAVLVAFYGGAAPLRIDPRDHLARFERELRLERSVLLRPRFALADAKTALDRLDLALRTQAPALRERVEGGHVIDGHGDLRPEHVCLLHPPVIIDCLEFNASLRQVDPFDEIAFLALECEFAGAAWIGPRLVDGCAAALGAPPTALLHLSTASRAALRARLAIAHLLDPRPRMPSRWPPLARRYLARALAALDALDGGDAFSPPRRDGSP